MINAAADSTAYPHEIVTQGSDESRVNEAPENAAATERPKDNNEQD